jgi:hypothetical protein
MSAAEQPIAKIVGRPRKSNLGPGPASGFKLVPSTAAPPELLFGRKQSVSPYLTALQELLRAGPDQFLEFANVGAKQSIWAQAKKHGLKILFAEKDGKLYVKLEQESGVEALVFDYANYPYGRSQYDIGRHLEYLGFKGQNVKELLQTLSANGKITLREIRQENGTTAKMWISLSRAHTSTESPRTAPAKP